MTDFEYFDLAGKVHPVTKRDSFGRIIDQYLFLAFNYNEMPNGFVIASSDDQGWIQTQAWVRNIATTL